MTHEQIIAELVRIRHSPHLDLILKARLGEVIEALKENNLNDALVRDEADDCKESESKLDLISRQDAIEAIESRQTEQWIESDIDYNSGLESALCEIKALPSAEPLYQYSEAYVNQLHGERDILQDMVDNMAEPKTGEWMMLERDENVHDICGVQTWGVNYMCDKCGFITTAIQDHFSQYKFCPSCGARMLGEDGEA